MGAEAYQGKDEVITGWIQLSNPASGSWAVALNVANASYICPHPQLMGAGARLPGGAEGIAAARPSLLFSFLAAGLPARAKGSSFASGLQVLFFTHKV